MSIITESITSDDWLSKPVIINPGELEYTAIVYAKVIRTQWLEKGPGVSMVSDEEYDIEELGVSYLRARLTNRDSFKLDLNKLSKDTAHEILNAICLAVIEEAKGEPDFAWDAESNEET